MYSVDLPRLKIPDSVLAVAVSRLKSPRICPQWGRKSKPPTSGLLFRRPLRFFTIQEARIATSKPLNFQPVAQLIPFLNDHRSIAGARQSVLATEAKREALAGNRGGQRTARLTLGTNDLRDFVSDNEILQAAFFKNSHFRCNILFDIQFFCSSIGQNLAKPSVYGIVKIGNKYCKNKKIRDL